MANSGSFVSLDVGDIFENNSNNSFFEVVKHISTGGFGDVYKVKDTNKGKELIAKIPIIRNEKEDVYRNKKQKHEANLLELLKDKNIPHVAKLYESFETEINNKIVTIIIMEIAQGVTMDEYLKNKSSNVLLEDDVKKILIKLCEAILELHKLGYIHRDLKSQNIFILEKNDDYEITIIDFGISAFYDQASSVNTATQVGTPFYSPPEQNKGIVSPSADVFAIGAIGFQLATGRNNLTQNGRYSPKEYEIKGYSISKEFNDVIITATWDDMSKRYPTIEDFMLSLSGSPPIHARPRIIVEGKGIPISKDYTIIGRKMENSKADIQVSEKAQPNEHYIGREHCYIKICDDGYYRIFDNNSKNGTVWKNKHNKWMKINNDRGLILGDQPLVIGLGYADKETGKLDMNNNPILPGVYKIIEYRPPNKNS